MKEKAVDLLMEAFADDPLLLWIFNQNMNPEVQRELHTLTVDYYSRYGIIDWSDCGHGVALWLPPGTDDLPFGFNVRVAWALARRGLLGTLCRGIKINNRFSVASEQNVWYLHAIAVRRQHWDKGIGTELINRMVNRNDYPLYLENTRSNNLFWYSKLGFKIVDMIQRSGMPTVWFMLKDNHLIDCDF